MASLSSMNLWLHKLAGTQVVLNSAVVTQQEEKSQAEGKEKRDVHRAPGSFLRLGGQTLLGTATESHIYHPPTWTLGLSA